MKKNNINALLLLLGVLGCFAMEPTDDNPMYLQSPEEYEHFRLTRSYGVLHFGCLSQDIIQDKIVPFLSQELETELKHTFLRHKMHSNSDLSPVSWQPVSLDINPFDMQQWKVFGYCDGTYTLVPADFDYASYDYANERYKRKMIGRLQDTDKQAIKILCHKGNSNISIYCPQEEVRNNDKHSFYGENDLTTQVRELPYKEKVNDHLLSNDGRWLLVCSNNSAAYVDIINVKQLKEIIFSDSIVGVCAAHHFPFFIVCSQTQLCLINPQSKSNQIFDFSRLCCGVKSIQISPSDKYLAMIQDKVLCIFNTDNLSFMKKITTQFGIKRAVFISDDVIVLAVNDGQLLICNNIFQSAPAYWWSRCMWRYPSNTMHIANPSPVLVFAPKSNVLFSLDPVEYGNKIHKFTIAKISDGTCIASLKVFPNNAVTMGLTQDERSIIFMHADDTASQLELYDQQEAAVLDFVTQKSNMYVLCCLWALYKKHQAKKEQGLSDAFERLMKHIRYYIN